MIRGYAMRSLRSNFLLLTFYFLLIAFYFLLIAYYLLFGEAAAGEGDEQ